MSESENKTHDDPLCTAASRSCLGGSPQIASFSTSLLSAVLMSVCALAARADHDSIQIACSTNNSPQIILRGEGDLLAGVQPVELWPADGNFAGKFLHDDPSFESLPPDRKIKNLRSPRPNQRLAIRRIKMSPGLLFHDPSTFKPILKKDGDIFEIHHDPQGQFGIHFLTVAARPGIYEATIDWVDLSNSAAPSNPITLRFRTVAHPRSADKSPRYICPMRCENEKTYPAPGRCPECNMKLSDVNAHRDHKPRHGGQFFMSPDQVHHLEGVRTGGEFRIYFYDEFTQPIQAADIEVRGQWKSPAAAPVNLKFRCDEKAAFQTAALPKDTATGRLSVWIRFAPEELEQLYEFEFAPSTQPQSAGK